MEILGQIKATKFVAFNGQSTGFLKADGTIDSSVFSLNNHTHTFASLTSKPTILSGYGITDAYTKVETLDNFVPYTGATKTINLNAKDLVNVAKLGISGITTPLTSLHVKGIGTSTYSQIVQEAPSGSQKLWSGAVADSVGSYLMNNAYYLTSNAFVPNHTSASGINFRNDGSIDFTTNTGLTIGTNFYLSSRLIISNTGIVKVTNLAGTGDRIIGASSDGTLKSLSYTTLAQYGITDAYTKTEVNSLDSNVVHKTGNETIAGNKNFTGQIISFSSGNTYSSSGFMSQGNGSTILPRIGFHQPSLFAGSLVMVGDGSFELRSNPDSNFASLKASSFIKSGGTSAQFLKADGSVDTNKYVDNFNSVNELDLNTIYQTAIYTGYNFTNGIGNGDMAVLNISNWGNNSPSSKYNLQISSGSGVNLSKLFFRTTANDGTGSWYELWSTKNFTQTNINNWNTAVGWGDHSTQGYLKAANLSNLVTLTTAQTISGLKEFSTGFTLKGYKHYADSTKNLVVNSTNAFNSNYTNITDSAIGIGNNVFPVMNLSTYNPVTEPWNNKGYLGIGSDIFTNFTGNTNYRPDHNAHDSWVGVGRLLGAGFIDGTNMTLVGTTNMHRNDNPYGDNVTIIGKGNSSGIGTKGTLLEPTRVVTATNGFNVRGIMNHVTIVGHENWSEDINHSVIVGSNNRPYGHIFNSLILGSNNVDLNVVADTSAPKMNLDSDVIIGSGNWKRTSRHAVSHNLLIGMDYGYGLGSDPNFNYRSLVEGRFATDAKFQVNGRLIAGFAKVNEDKPNITKIVYSASGLGAGVTFNQSLGELTFTGASSNANILIKAFLANPDKSYLIDIRNISGSQTGTWGHQIGTITDSGNVASYIHTGAYSFDSNTTFRFTTEGAFVGVIKITLSETNLTTSPSIPSLTLLDSNENTSVEVRSSQVNSIVFGKNSGQFLHAGSNMTIYGQNAYTHSIFGSNSIIIGNYAAELNSSSTQDVILGNEILRYAYKGSGSNTLVGNKIITDPTSRITLNTVMGFLALSGSKSSDQNTVIGYGAGNTLHTSSSNVLMGVLAGRFKYGTLNTFIGYNAGGFGITESTFNNVTVIGSEVIHEGGDNSITIGNTNVTDNYFRGIIHAGSFKVRGGLSTSVLLADGSTIPISSISSIDGIDKVSSNLVEGVDWEIRNSTNIPGSLPITGDSYLDFKNGFATLGSDTSSFYVNDEYEATIESAGINQIGNYSNNFAGPLFAGQHLTFKNGTNRIKLETISNKFVTSNTTGTLFSAGINNFEIGNGSSKLALSTSGITALRTFTLPNKDGVLAIVEDTVATTGNQTIDGLKNFSNLKLNSKTVGTSLNSTLEWGATGGTIKLIIGNENTNDIPLPAVTYNNTTLAAATYGNYAGFINSELKSNGNPTDDWHHRIRMLHPNSAGFYTEIAVAMTGAPGMFYKQYAGGSTIGWTQVADLNTFQTFTAAKAFQGLVTTTSTGNTWATGGILVNGSGDLGAGVTTLKPRIGFHNSGLFAGSLVMEAAGAFELHSNPDADFASLKASSFIVSGKTSNDVLLGDGTTIAKSSLGGSYTLPASTSGALGGIKLYSDAFTVNPNTPNNTASRSYGLQVTSGGQAAVNVPWTDTTYSTGTAVNISGADTVAKLWTGAILRDYLVNLTTAQTIDGAKTFSSIVVGSAGFKLGSGTNSKVLLDGGGSQLLSTIVQTTGDQTITGDKTFNNNLICSSNITGNAFVKTGGTVNDILMANGTTILKSSITGTTYATGTLAEINAGTNATRVWTPLILRDSLVTIGTAQTITGTKTFNQSITAPSFLEGSLRSLKTNIKPFEESGLDLVNKLEIVTFDRKDSEIRNKIGIIADDSPNEFLSETFDSVDLYKTTFIQAKAIQELSEENRILREELNNLRELVMSKLNQI